ncbi:MAG TPA: apolipoprotein N-acyltransferase, partial [Vicingus sp.]|nr:apolipoprotein N-acyltransferase [Vicingus sp.]
KIYHKSKLVLGVEKMPFSSLLSPIEKFAINLGGTTGSYGVEKEAKIFDNEKTKIAPVICYESIYGEYVTDYVKKGANVIFIITNDGWWEDTPGYKQHLAYGRLRAIETRRSIARSANTGISCFINQRGDVLQATNWWEQDVIAGKINLNNQTTFYTIHGDYIGRVAAFIGALMLLWNITFVIKKQN